MKYMGSKNRIAKYIIPIMLSERKENQTWVEPFVGGANIIDKIDGERIGADINPYLISVLISIREMYNIGHKIFVSEYNAPDDFECVWEGKIVSNLKTDANNKHAIEKLFKYSGR